MLPTEDNTLISIYQQSFLSWIRFLKTLFPYAFVASLLSMLLTKLSITEEQSPHYLLQHFHLGETRLLWINLCLSILYALISVMTYTILLKKANSLLIESPLLAKVVLWQSFLRLPKLFFALLFSIASLTLGFLAFAVPGFYLITVLFIFYPLIVLSPHSIAHCFKESIQLVRHHWWRCTASIVLPTLLLTHLSQTLLNKLINFIPNEGLFLPKLILLTLFAATIIAFLLPWLSIQTLFTLNDLRIRLNKQQRLEQYS